MQEYRKRIIENILEKKLQSSGAVLVVGPKWCGKTTLAKRYAKTVVNVDSSENLKLAELMPEALLEGKSPCLLDEWQWVPSLWDLVRRRVDDVQEMGQYILTGSAVPNDDDRMHHTGTGRFSHLFLRTMSLQETGDSSGKISLGELFDAPDKIFYQNFLGLDRIAYLICRGGWPGALGLSPNAALEAPFNYYDSLIKSDLTRVRGIRRSPERFIRLLRSLARNQGTQASLPVIAGDIVAGDGVTFDVATVGSYIDALKTLFVVEDMKAWNPNIRSKAAVRTSDTRYFVDPSIAIAALGLGPKDLINDLNTFGFFFEALCIRDLRVYAQALDGEVYHYRDSNGLECDGVVHLRNGKYGLVEIKLGGEKGIEDGAATLNKLESIIDKDKMHAPSFKMVLVGIGKFAYRRDDGVYVVPLCCLGV